MLVRYLGPHDEVNIDIIPPASCTRGGTVDVPAEIAENLVQQHSWEYADPSDAPPPVPAVDPAPDAEGIKPAKPKSSRKPRAAAGDKES